MKAEELRIGNYVEFKEEGTIFQVTRILEDGLYLKNALEETYIELDRMGPVSLTTEWMENSDLEYLGFSPAYSIYRKHKFEMTVNNKKGTFIEDWTNVEIKSVHQLQNLYFALEEEELQINNKDI